MASTKTGSKEELEAGVAELERALADAQAQLRAAEATLHDFEEQQSQAAGRLALAMRAAADFEARLQVQREALRQAARESAETALAQAVETRDGAARRLAGAIGTVLSGLDELESARQEVELAAAALQEYIAEEIRVRAEPPELLEQWDLLCDEVAAANEPLELEDELAGRAREATGDEDAGDAEPADDAAARASSAS